MLVKANFKEEKLLNTLPLNKIIFIWWACFACHNGIIEDM